MGDYLSWQASESEERAARIGVSMLAEVCGVDISNKANAAFVQRVAHLLASRDAEIRWARNILHEVANCGD